MDGFCFVFVNAFISLSTINCRYVTHKVLNILSHSFIQSNCFICQQSEEPLIFTYDGTKLNMSNNKNTIMRNEIKIYFRSNMVWFAC